MTISYEEALSTLQAMFGETWNTEALDSVLRHFEGHMENTIEAILNHGSRSPDALIAKLDPSNNNSTDFDEDLARQLAREDQPRSATTRATGTISTARGTPTELPPEFLRIPGYSIPSTVSADEQLARMLQDEMLQRELVNNREFGHLARRETSRSNYPGPGGGTSEGPNIMDKLAEMGDQAKSRLTLWAAQLNAQSKKMGLFTDTPTATQERTSLLAGGGTEEEVAFGATAGSNSRDYEMKSMEGRAGSKKDK